MYFAVWFWVYGRWSIHSQGFHTKTDARKFLDSKKRWRLMRIMRVTRRSMIVVGQYTRKDGDTKLYKYRNSQEKKRT